MNKSVENFLLLTRIPRQSGHEEAVSRFLCQWAADRGLTAVRDSANNVIIDKPGAPGLENAPRTILQAHMDMVCVAEEGRVYDPLTDPIRVINDGETLTADGTSLGADNGAGVAVAMTVLEDGDGRFGPVRAIFTTDEENGMTGALTVDPRHLDAKYLINLDWEGYGSLCCSSAGSDMYSFRRPAHWVGGNGLRFYSLTVQGLEGGHSGAQIHLGRANAIRMAGNILLSGGEKAPGLSLASFKGGSAHNAIPSSCAAVAAVPAEQAEAFLSAAMETVDRLLEQCALTDPGASVTLTETDGADTVLTPDDTRTVLEMLTAVHDGVNTMSPAIPGLVESSASLGLAALDEDGFSFVIHQRSSEPAITEAMKKTYSEQAKRFGFAMTVLSSSPGWPLNPHSRLVALCADCFRALEGREIRVEPVHAGLECGAWANKNPTLDIISIGPELRDIHSPKETLVIKSMEQTETLVKSILKEIAKE
ncbi:MAG: beta-Ala-His dipeptidase [Oscillospiraceae bacterium]|nr:beta-Ala-His dipeptidase [Oscillospiraceae bacterium]